MRIFRRRLDLRLIERDLYELKFAGLAQQLRCEVDRGERPCRPDESRELGRDIASGGGDEPPEATGSAPGWA